MNCPACHADLPADAPFCSQCGSATLDATLVDATVVESRPGGPRPASSPATSMTAGAMVAGRYRIVGLLGTGGMGEVYRADDLTLGQSVALKFLPEAVARDDRRLERFYAEARTAREVAHPNVCRVYDIGEVDGRPFISMEYVDGEDLSSLIRRIGRLPEEKAVDLARQLCAGLAALHDRGVLHRDLKPANVMLDGRGHVRITDFGLAALAREITGAEVRSGTPAYMAPEQLTGQEVTERSDIYSLGLVLYEIFTGRPAYDASSVAELSQQRTSTPVSVTTHVSEIDPAVDRVISRCLNPDPAQRPPSAVALAAALPGGDPLAAALAAGETPSPELVAASGGEGGLHPGWVAACVLATVAAVVIFAQLVVEQRLHTHFQLTAPGELSIRARDLATAVGYGSVLDEAHGYGSHSNWIRYLARTDTTATRWDRLDERPSAVLYWYRSSPEPLVPTSPQQVPTLSDPSFDRTGMVSVLLEPDGALLSFNGIPPESLAGVDSTLVLDWDRFFSAAGLDRANFREVAAEWIPTHHAEARLAWEGVYPGQPQMPVRIEAGHVGHLATYWAIRGPWVESLRTASNPAKPSIFTVDFLLTAVFLLVLLVGFVLAGRNYRRGRGDIQGARRLAVFIGITWTLNWVFRAEHQADPNRFPDQIFMALGFSLIVAAMVWSLYMALEPLVRRQWPQCMVAWSRLLRGQVRDPLVGRSILLGGVIYLGIVMLDAAQYQTLVAFDVMTPSPRSISWTTLMGPSGWITVTTNTLVNALLQPMLMFIFLVLLRIPLRKQWLANVAFVIIVGLVDMGSSLSWRVDLGYGLLRAAMIVVILSRVGLLPLTLALFYQRLMIRFPITLDGDAFYADASAFAIAVLIGLTVYGAYAALAGRSLFRETFGD